MSNNDTRPIGMFDSGFGGLTVLAQMKKYLPGENVIYYGDNARAPYGPRSAQEVITFNHEIIEWMLLKNVKAIIMACNTSTSHSIVYNREHFDVPFISLIDQGIDALADMTSTRKIAVIATQGTINSGSFGRAIKSKFPGLDVLEIACPLFVPLIESGSIYDEETKAIALGYLAPAFDQNVDVVILGCTHYPFLVPILVGIAPENVSFLDPAVGAVQYVDRFLTDKGMTSNAPVGRYEYYTSGDAENFKQLGAGYLGFPLENVYHKAF